MRSDRYTAPEKDHGNHQAQGDRHNMRVPWYAPLAQKQSIRTDVWRGINNHDYLLHAGSTV